MSETLDGTAPQQRRPLDVSEWPVVRKVALVLAIPLLLAVVLGGMRIQTELSRASDATATSSQVTVLGPAVAYLSAAEDAAIVFRETDDKALRTAALKTVNDAAAQLETAWSQAELSDAQRQQVRSLLDGTQGLRDGSAYAIVSTAVNQLERLEAEVTLGIASMTDTGSRIESKIALVGQLNEGRLSVTEQQLLVVQRPEIIPKNELYGYLGVESAAIGNLELLLPDDASVKLLREYNSSNNGLLGIGTPELKGEQPMQLYDQLADDLLVEIEDSLAAAAAASNRTALITAVLTGLALLVAIGLALLVSRILVRPIRQVRDGALAVAHERLPETVRRIRAGLEPGEIEPIPVTTHEEMGQLARAVDDLHGTAVRMAQGEAELRSRVADMFVTLSRRNTSLVNQQLRLIEKLETDEEDPERLESLFRLDHLASRMRRTAESLVVLADAPTQHSEQAALSVDEALQAALAGVQEYQRVQLSGAPSLRISGAAAPDVVHLFTELVDNALSFSPPSAPVSVTTSTPAGLVLVEIADAGLGIDQQTLHELNETLRTGAEVSAETARRMGLFVVARLARRHGLTVALERNADGGTTAKVYIPRPLLSSSDSPLTPPAPAEAHDEAEVEVVEVPEPVDISEVVFGRPAAVDETEPEHEPETDTETDTPSSPVPDRESVPEPVARVDAAPVAHGRAPVANGQVPDRLDTLSAVINANIRLPQREPGTAPQPSPLTSLLPKRGPSPAPAAFRPVVSAQPDPDTVDESREAEFLEPGSGPIAVPTAAAADDVIDDHVDDQEMDSAPAYREPVVNGSARVNGSAPANGSARVNGAVPVNGSPSVNGSAPGSGAALPQLDPLSAAYAVDERDRGDDDDETPLFRMLRSGWFSTSGEERAWDAGGVDDGWRAADRATDAAPSRLTTSGLPVRDPGNRLVPGGVAQAAPVVRRDPEAIKARLAAHAAGVARGRSVAGSPYPDRSTDATEDVSS